MAGKISLVEEKIPSVHFFLAKYRNEIILIDKVTNVFPVEHGQGEYITARFNV